MAETKIANLALQGGGTHGAFTWGVLERLLEEPRFEIEGVSATSAGAMNAAVLAHITGPDGQVVTIDLDPGLARRARDRLRAAGYPAVVVSCADGGFGLGPDFPPDVGRRPGARDRGGYPGLAGFLHGFGCATLSKSRAKEGRKHRREWAGCLTCR